MDNATHDLVELIHAADCRLVLAVSGGGSGAISDLLTVPGGSGSLLEAVVPYSAPSLDGWLGATPDQYCSDRTAKAMAMAAFQRARDLAPRDAPTALVGIGCTASLVSDHPKRGPHRIHVARQTAAETVVESLELNKGLRDRAEEEHVAASMILEAIADAAASLKGADSPIRSGHELHEEPLQRRSQKALPAWTDLLLGSRDVVFNDDTSLRDWCRATGAESSGAQSSDTAAGEESAVTSRAFVPEVIFPGAFRPFHSGHRRMAQIAAKRTGKRVWLELSIANVDKPPLDYIEIAERLESLAPMPVALTYAARFTEKATIFPGVTFVVGADTIERIADRRYYSGSRERAAAATRSIVEQDCRFLVFGRTIGGNFTGLNDLTLPKELRDRCDGVPESDFRDDVSSTELRAQAK